MPRRKHKQPWVAEAIGVPGAEPVVPGATDRRFALTDDERLKARILTRTLLALQGPAEAKGARRGLFCSALMAIESGVSRADFLVACDEEYTHAGMYPVSTKVYSGQDMVGEADEPKERKP